MISEIQARVLLLDYSAVLYFAAFISKSTQYDAAQSMPTRSQWISYDFPGFWNSTFLKCYVRRHISSVSLLRAHSFSFVLKQAVAIAFAV